MNIGIVNVCLLTFLGLKSPVPCFLDLLSSLVQLSCKPYSYNKTCISDTSITWIEKKRAVKVIAAMKTKGHVLEKKEYKCISKWLLQNKISAEIISKMKSRNDIKRAFVR